MKIFTADQQKRWDAFTMLNEPISSENLMWRAAKNIFESLKNLLDVNEKIIVLCGSGNNGGDGLCLAKMLRDDFFKVEVWYFPISNQSTENRYYFDIVKSTEEITVQTFTPEQSIPAVEKNVLFMDAIAGNGFKPLWRNGWESVIKSLNSLPNTKISVDVPSGLHDDFDDTKDTILLADHTFSIQAPKQSFFYPEASKYIGRWQIVDIGLSPLFYQNEECDSIVLDLNELKSFFKNRNMFTAKWDFGHAAMICGSKNMPGAALLATEACLRSGPGLVTAYVPDSIAIVFPYRLPEVMLVVNGKEIWTEEVTLKPGTTAIGIGPGLGRDAITTNRLIQFLKANSQIPKVLDADALNILSLQQNEWSSLVKNAILTPHEKEFDRLFGQHHTLRDREKTALEMAEKHEIIIILKGAYTRIFTPEKKMYINTIGNPGMAKGGSGDVLTGIITGLLAQSYSLKEAALLGVFVHGLAGDLAAKELSQTFMLPSDLIGFLAKCWQQLEDSACQKV